MSKRPANREVLHEVAKCLKKKALRDHDLTSAEAAERLGVKRQTMWLYLNEKCMPGGHVLRRACELWKIPLFIFPKDGSGSAKPRPQPKQQEFPFESLDDIGPDQIETRLISRLGGFELRVRIKAAS